MAFLAAGFWFCRSEKASTLKLRQVPTHASASWCVLLASIAPVLRATRAITLGFTFSATLMPWYSSKSCCARVGQGNNAERVSIWPE